LVSRSHAGVHKHFTARPQDRVDAQEAADATIGRYARDLSSKHIGDAAEADETARQREEGSMHVGAPLVADEQPTELVEPRESALDDHRWQPRPEPCSVWRRAISDAIPRRRSSRRYLSWS